jgi:hypothetical protein
MTDTDTSTGHTSYYILNRDYFSECFDESASTVTGLKKYRQAIFFIIVACLFYLMDIESYVVWFLVCLTVIELLSIRYKRSWWITRQMLSRTAGSRINIRIDDQGIFTEGTYHQQNMAWNDITEIKSTDKGFVILHNSVTNYLSRNGLNENALALLAAKQIG